MSAGLPPQAVALDQMASLHRAALMGMLFMQFVTLASLVAVKVAVEGVRGLQPLTAGFRMPLIKLPAFTMMACLLLADFIGVPRGHC
jgi:hypothetical protein